MVVHENHARRAFDDGRPEHLPGVDQGRIQNAASNQYPPNHSMLGVQQEGMELLLAEIPQERPQSGKDVFRAPNGLLVPSRVHGCPTPQFQGCDDPACRWRTRVRVGPPGIPAAGWRGGERKPGVGAAEFWCRSWSATSSADPYFPPLLTRIARSSRTERAVGPRVRRRSLGRSPTNQWEIGAFSRTSLFAFAGHPRLSTILHLPKEK